MFTEIQKADLFDGAIITCKANVIQTKVPCVENPLLDVIDDVSSRIHSFCSVISSTYIALQTNISSKSLLLQWYLRKCNVSSVNFDIMQVIAPCISL